MPETYRSVHHQILQALREALCALELPELPTDEIQVRDNFWFESTIYRGITCHPLGEEYDDGVIGKEDVGYRCGITFVTSKSGAGLLSVETRKLWVESARRRFKNQRIPITEFDFETVKQHVLRVRHNFPAIPKEFRAKFAAEQLIATAWAREVPDDGSE